MTKRPDMIGNQFAKGNGANVSSFKAGRIPWNKGRRFSEQTRRKMSEARHNFYAKGGAHPLKGKARPDMVGANNPNWNKYGNKHPRWTDAKKRPFYKSIREIFKYKEWRQAVFSRDGFVCRLCGNKKSYVEADHFPTRFVDIVRNNNIQNIDDAINCAELWDVSNGRTLCQLCHRNTDTWGRRNGLCKAK